MSDFRGYINPFPPGAPTADGQESLMPEPGPNVELYIENRYGKQIDAIIASVRKGTVVAVVETYLLAPGAFRAQKRRRILTERIEAIRDKGGDILELSTGHKASRRLPAMMLRAFEMIANSGRARAHNRPGRQIKWNLTTEQRELAEGLWRSRKFVNDWDRATAIQRRLKMKISRGWLRRTFGSPHESK